MTRRFVILAVAVGAALVSCNGESARGPAKDVDARSDAGAPSPAPAPAAGKCTTDADCRTWASYCAETPCVCVVLAKSEADPRCSAQGNVSCFADPCMKKTAACQGGRCELVIGATP
jgi:hypothetical protein